MADGVTFAAVRKLALALPGVEEGTSTARRRSSSAASYSRGCATL